MWFICLSSFVILNTCITHGIKDSIFSRNLSFKGYDFIQRVNQCGTWHALLRAPCVFVAAKHYNELTELPTILLWPVIRTAHDKSQGTEALSKAFSRHAICLVNNMIHLTGQKDLTQLPRANVFITLVQCCGEVVACRKWWPQSGGHS